VVRPTLWFVVQPFAESAPFAPFEESARGPHGAAQFGGGTFPVQRTHARVQCLDSRGREGPQCVLVVGLVLNAPFKPSAIGAGAGAG
jgi:hypothetical protein